LSAENAISFTKNVYFSRILDSAAQGGGNTRFFPPPRAKPIFLICLMTISVAEVFILKL
jgi:hypothetical protein